ncbi:DUF421 domain-containing protein [Sphingobacterium sp. SGR-19]|uniref:DUF421 domain-containing protein n=1 Tax=Sphingobacterium sp. SGR-19 TaxID=2710886 RepID=UPI0013EA4C3A|nr:YetF domain-containing protein [Sphingobacterium sp. SGR-19]NGM65284.1 DUF421 domain-containing protein [Sphingobacterium sp. SGR-19]
MFDVDIKNLLIESIEWHFITEIILRTAIMFLMILLVLRLSGKRGVRQLTLFEVAIILGLGSAAGDPMFQEDIPVFHALVVFAVVMTIYKTLTWIASKSLSIHRILEGKEMTVVENGVFSVKNEKDNDFSTVEFFAELRNQSVEHLGQVRTAVLETDGTISVLFYTDEEVKFGLPLFPDVYKEADLSASDSVLACMNCGCIQQRDHILKNSTCPRCRHGKWAKALNTRRIV